MTGTIDVVARFSKLTYALLADSGWYTIDTSYAEETTWGFKKGCGFFDKLCHDTKQYSEFCYNADPGCDSSLVWKSSCFVHPLLKNDNCKVFNAFSNGDCENTANEHPQKELMAQAWTPTSRCYLSSALNKGYVNDEQLSAGCYESSCVGGVLKITNPANGQSVACNSEAEKVEASALGDFTG